jgi:hypothetical protein
MKIMAVAMAVSSVLVLNGCATPGDMYFGEEPRQVTAEDGVHDACLSRQNTGGDYNNCMSCLFSKKGIPNNHFGNCDMGKMMADYRNWTGTAEHARWEDSPVTPYYGPSGSTTPNAPAPTYVSAPAPAPTYVSAPAPTYVSAPDDSEDSNPAKFIACAMGAHGIPGVPSISNELGVYGGVSGCLSPEDAFVVETIGAGIQTFMNNSVF